MMKGKNKDKNKSKIRQRVLKESKNINNRKITGKGKVKAIKSYLFTIMNIFQV